MGAKTKRQCTTLCPQPDIPFPTRPGTEDMVGTMERTYVPSEPPTA
jgi:hypothetical protein